MNSEKIVWNRLSSNKNPRAQELLENNIDLIIEDWICLNPSEFAMDIIRQKPSLINWYYLSSNPYAMKILKAYPEKINWSALSNNPSDEALDMLEANREKIYWKNLCRNDNKRAIEIMKSNPTMIEWDWLSVGNNYDKIMEIFPEHINHKVFILDSIFEVDIQ